MNIKIKNCDMNPIIKCTKCGVKLVEKELRGTYITNRDPSKDDNPDNMYAWINKENRKIYHRFNYLWDLLKEFTPSEMDTYINEMYVCNHCKGVLGCCRDCNEKKIIEIG